MEPFATFFSYALNFTCCSLHLQELIVGCILGLKEEQAIEKFAPRFLESGHGCFAVPQHESMKLT